MTDLPRLDATAAAAAVASGTVSAVELVNWTLERIKAVDPVLNCYVSVLGSRAVAQAEAVEQATSAKTGPFLGVPIAVKDNIHLSGVPTSAGLRPPVDPEPTRSAAVLHRLEAAGAIVIGKTNLHQFAYGATGDVSGFGPVRNPHDRGRMSGGSSSGSGAAVAAGLCFAALGTDTGGSVRVPAAFCGVVGLKPTQGGISTDGVVPLSRTLDCVGLMARTVGDCATLLDVLTQRTTHRETTATTRLNGLRIGMPTTFYFDDVQPPVRAAVLRALATCQELGAELVPVELPDMSLMTAIQRRVLATEADVSLGEFVDHRSESIHPEVLDRILNAPRAVGDDYELARKARRHFAEAVFRQVDVIATPTVPVTAPLVQQRIVDLPAGVADVGSTLTRNTAAANLLGLPALTVPCGRSPTGLPVGLQLLGPWHAERRLLTVAAAFERTRSREDHPHDIPA
ncbi:amidase [Actinoallomurus sp. NBC_01490]|jgi:aspartyl-tRNA(Asn)/glutamyl-tRNA(Gln) amidotransferase subunit A|uniref:amidase n=1 Tax=Actinoallomurus sp. NBC_01490 TaxID=2903557 RepID=UPI002E3274E0|nr:amidase [Actinoallomurus sp. NBC_01490]